MVNISTIAHCFGLKPKVLYRWYINVISDYHKDRSEKRFAGWEVRQVDEQTGLILKEQPVHILEPQNVGPNMCIDEKMIGRRYCMIISNADTGQIALLLDSDVPALVTQAIALLGHDALQRVEYINSDMSAAILKICRLALPMALSVIDKFHVVKQLIDAMQSVRIEIKKKLGASTKTQRGNPNGWTNKEMLSKARYALLHNYSTMLEHEFYLLEALFKKYPKLQKAHELYCDLMLWYKRAQISTSQAQLRLEFDQWCDKAQKYKIVAFKKLANTMCALLPEILRYFIDGQTNAMAENVNSRIQRLAANNYGIRNRDFFFYRCRVYFALAPQKKN